MQLMEKIIWLQLVSAHAYIEQVCTHTTTTSSHFWRLFKKIPSKHLCIISPEVQGHWQRLGERGSSHGDARLRAPSTSNPWYSWLPSQAMTLPWGSTHPAVYQPSSELVCASQLTITFAGMAFRNRLCPGIVQKRVLILGVKVESVMIRIRRANNVHEGAFMPGVSFVYCKVKLFLYCKVKLFPNMS